MGAETQMKCEKGKNGAKTEATTNLRCNPDRPQPKRPDQLAVHGKVKFLRLSAMGHMP
jgi:hypothetical protein